MKKAIYLPLLFGAGFLASLTTQAASLTNYVTEWSVYHSQPAHSIFDDSEIIAKANHSNVLAYAFLQVWNPDKTDPKFNLPENYAGVLHFDDIYANLPSWANGSGWRTFCSNTPAGSCAAIQQDCRTGACHLALLDYRDLDIGMINNFGDFSNLKTDNYVTKVIAIGGANTAQNSSVSTHTFDAIFNNQITFLYSLKQWMTQLKPQGISGVDYDFEPPILADGSQAPASNETKADYANLFDLVKQTRKALGKDAYVSVTITTNKDYLKTINDSITGGWFKNIAPYVNSVNIMTYDMHGPWSLSGDPGATPHSMLKTPEAISHAYAVNYAVEDVIDQVLSYGAPANKLQAGIAAYGRGFAGVEQGPNTNFPGFDQPWTGPSKFSSATQDGMLDYNKIIKLLDKDNSYKIYNIQSGNDTIASYIYSPTAKQFVGYDSPEEIKSLCAFIKKRGLKGAILWSIDADADYNDSLTKTYQDACGS